MRKFSPPPVSFAKAFGKRLEELRKKKGMSQSQLAKEAGRGNNNAISRLERGDAEMISLSILDYYIMAAKSVGLPAAWLLLTEDEPAERLNHEELAKDESLIVGVYRDLSPALKQRLYGYAEALRAAQEEINGRDEQQAEEMGEDLDRSLRQASPRSAKGA
jgi:transcriptional regulator with XRE-family HTH domain